MYENTKFSKNTVWLIGGRVYHMLLSLVVSVLTARYLGPSNYGVINYAVSLTAMFTSFCTLGINSIIVNELIHNNDKQGEIIGTSIVMRFISSVLSVITVVLLSHILNPSDKVVVTVTFIYSLSLIFQSFDTIKYYYQAQLRSKVPTSVEAIAYTVVSVYKIFLLIYGKNIYWFAATHTIELMVIAVLLYRTYALDAWNKQSLSHSWKRAVSLFSKSYHFILSGMMVAIYGQMDKIMLKSMLNSKSVGFYSAALAVCQMWPFVLSAIIESSRPLILEQADRNREKYNKYITRLYCAIIYVSLIAAIGISVLSKLIIKILYGQQYMPAQIPLCIICWYTAFSYLGVARSIWIVSNGKQKYEKYIAGIGAISNLIMNWLFIPVWGVNGAAFATLLTQVITNFGAGFLFKEIRENNILILRSFNILKVIDYPKDNKI